MKIYDLNTIYKGRDLSPEVTSLLELLGRYGFTYTVTGNANKTIRIYQGQRDVGYVNLSVQRKGVLGYHFALFGRHADACPEDLVDGIVTTFAERYEISPEAIFIQHNRNHAYLIFREPTAALKVLLQDIGVSLSSDTQVVLTGQKYVEGRITDVMMRRRERSPEARKVCLANYGFNCFVCGLNIRSKYIGLEIEVIHVHHEEPLAGTTKEREFDPIATMKPVCPNCHAVIHTKEPPYSILEVKDMLGLLTDVG